MLRQNRMRLGVAAVAAIVFIGLGVLVISASKGRASASEKVEAATQNDWTRSARYASRADKQTGKSGGTGTAKNVKLALDWLVRHQADDGSWSGENYSVSCRKPDDPCANQDGWHASTGPSLPGFDVGVTGLAVLAMAGRGNTHIEAEKKEYRESVDRAITWLLKQQSESTDDAKRGVIGHSEREEWIYNHAIATMALGELLLGSGDVDRLAAPFLAAVEYCLRGQTKGYGWKYTYQSIMSDSSVTMWMANAVLVAKACSEAGLIKLDAEKIETSLSSAEKWILAVTAKSSGVVGYQAPGDEGSRMQGVYGKEFPFDKGKMLPHTAAALEFAITRGKRGVEPLLKWEGLLVKTPPEWKPARGSELSSISFYYWYYAAHAMFQIGDKPWKKFNKSLKTALRKSQRTRGCEKGSWDPIGEWGIAGGRVYSTAMGALTLECYYRHAKEEQPKPKDD